MDKGNLEAVVEAAPPNSAPVWPPEKFVRAPGVFLEQPEAKPCFKNGNATFCLSFLRSDILILLYGPQYLMPAIKICLRLGPGASIELSLQLRRERELG